MRVTVAVAVILWLVYCPIALLTDRGQRFFVADLGITLTLPAIGVLVLLFSRLLTQMLERRIDQRVSRVESMSLGEREDELQRVVAEMERKTSPRRPADADTLQTLRSLLDDSAGHAE